VKNKQTLLGVLLIGVIALTAMTTRRILAQQFPMIDQLAHHVVQKYQTSSCEQLLQEKSAPKPKSEAEQKVITMLRTDPQMRAAFINQVAAPIVNKMFECGMVP
jgi:hypothetical protein